MGVSRDKLLSKREYHLYSLAWLFILLGWLMVLNYLSNKFFYRLDLTSGKAYTLSKSTKAILKGLTQPVSITFYASGNFPPALKSDINQTRDLLSEYQIYSRGKLKFEMINPDTNPGLQEKLKTREVEPIQFQVRGASEFSLRQGYMAIEINYLDQRQLFPNALDMADFEYAMSSAILKLTSEKNIGVAFLTGHNEPDSFQKLKKMRAAVEQQYVFTTVDTTDGEPVAEDVSVLLVIGPSRVPDLDKYALDQFLMRGGKIIFLVDGTEVAEEYLMAFPKDDGLDDLLASYGVKRNHDLVLDIFNEKVAYRQGMFQLIQPYPLWVKMNIPKLEAANILPASQIINSLGSVTLPWASSLELNSSVQGIKATELLKSSPKSWVQTGQFSLDPNRLPPPLPMTGMGEKSRLLGVLVEGSFKSFFAGKPEPKPAQGGTESKKESKEKPARLDQSKPTSIIVVNNSRFIRDDYIGLGDSNLDLVLNSIDWMTWGGKLIGVRSRISTDRPFNQDINMCLSQRTCGTGSVVKLLTARLLGPFVLPLAVIIYGLARFQLRRRAKRSWQEAMEAGK